MESKPKFRPLSFILAVLVVLASGFLVRVFIIFHDCGHGSFFASNKANDTVGIITGILTLTPYYYWRHDHAIHDATVSDLDRRGIGIKRGAGAVQWPSA